MDKLFDSLKKNVSAAKSEAGKFTKVVLDKTTNIVDITKLKIAKNESDSKISKLQAKIGEIIYAQYLSGAEVSEDISDICIEIDKFKAESDDLTDQIALLKNAYVCTECGQHNDKSNEYCSKCGTKINRSEPECVVPDDIIDAEPPKAQPAFDTEGASVVDVVPNDQV